MSVAEILEQVSRLTPAERQEVVAALRREDEEWQNKTIEERRAELHRRLMADGMLKNIPTRREKPPELRDFKPIEVEGKPVSETIIEERR